MNTKTKKTKRGFTITELVIVIAVIAILAAVLIPTFSNVINRANESAAMQEARNEWSNFQVEVATNAPENNDYLIKSGDYYFIVENGQFNEEALAEGVTETAPPDGYTNATQVENGTAINVGTTESAFNVTYTYANSNIKIYKLTVA